MEDYTGLVKSLRWLSYMFPETHPTKDDTDRISNNIHLYCKSAADAIEELSKPKWISVNDKLPDDEECVFVVRKFLGVKGQVPPSTYTEIAYRIGDRWIADSDEFKIAKHRHTDPIYWMPLPEPPKEAEEET